jgi:hypothetical protein
MKTLHDNIAIKPIQFNHAQQVESANARFVRTDKLFRDLVSSELVMDGPNDLKRGDIVYFRGDIYNHPTVQKISSLNGVEFVLLPISLAVAVQKKEA